MYIYIYIYIYMFHRMFSKELGSGGEGVSISAITATSSRSKQQLDCDEVCRQLQRNRELALALDINNPIIDPEESGTSGDTVQFSPYLMEEAR